MATVPRAINIMRTVESTLLPAVSALLKTLPDADVELFSDDLRGSTFNLKYRLCAPTTLPAGEYSHTTYQPCARMVPSAPLDCR